MTTLSSLHFAIPAGMAVPEWIHLTPAGTFSGSDGRGPFRLPDDVDALIARSMAAGKLPIDENHATDLAAPAGHPAPARGWIVAMAARADGIWGHVEWTGAGRRLVGDGAYRGISPVFMAHEEGGELVQILRAALTNDPNLRLASLHHRSTSMDFLARLAKALGLDRPSEDDVVTAVTAHAAGLGKIVQAAGLQAGASADAVVAHLSARAPADPKLEAIRAALKEGGVEYDTATAEQIATHLNAARAGGGDAELRKTIVSLQARLDTLSAETAREKAVAFVDAAIAGGKPIRPLRDHYIARHQKDAASVEKEVGALVSINAGGIVRAPQPAAEGGLTPEELGVAELMGIDAKTFAASKAEIAKSFG